jgi:hypothetical protein
MLLESESSIQRGVRCSAKTDARVEIFIPKLEQTAGLLKVGWRNSQSCQGYLITRCVGVLGFGKSA